LRGSGPGVKSDITSRDLQLEVSLSLPYVAFHDNWNSIPGRHTTALLNLFITALVNLHLHLQYNTAKMASSSVPATPLLYSCIAYKNTILAEHTVSAASGTSSLASVILPKIKHTSPEKLTYTHNANLIHYIADAGSASANPDSLNAPNLTYLVVAKGDLGRRVPFGFLVEIKKRFLKAYNPENTEFSSLPAYGAAAYNAQLKALMIEYGTTKSGQEDAFKNVQGEIDNVRGIMTENIERVLERGERLDLLVDKTDRLGGSARDFRVRSRGLKRRMWWKNMKLMVMLVVVIVFLLYLMVGMGCGLPGKLFAPSIIRNSTNITDSMVSLRSPRMNAGQISLITTLGVRAVLFNTTLVSSSIRSCNIAMRNIVQTLPKHYHPSPSSPPTAAQPSSSQLASLSPRSLSPIPQTPPPQPPPSP
jgi:vesicle-associated membrane protein 7